MPFDENGNYHPGFMEKLTGFTITMKQWVEAGCPRRDPEEVKENFRTHCNPPGAPCEMYDPNNRTIPIIGIKGVCKGCGCHVSDDPNELLNALTFPDKPCPLKKFDACVVDNDGDDTTTEVNDSI